ncbi:MAG: transcriptional regulator [Pseudonocardia sp.]|jgi:DNA-binding HxlR family transcriptional regulator|nr:transcriptional regulator [Pseudonocardia sp.]
MNVSVEVGPGFEPPSLVADVFDANCPTRTVLDNVTSRWAVLVLWALLDGTQRFSDLRRRIGGVSEKMLAQTLQRLERDGFVHRLAHPVIPPHVDYSLTPLGETAARQVAGLTSWIEGQLSSVLASRAAYDSEHAAGPVR